MKKNCIRITSIFISILMLITVLPVNAFAKEKEEQQFANSQLSLISDKESTLAKGVTQNIYTVYDKNGKQVKMFSAVVDPTVDTVKMFTSYQNMDNTRYGMSKLTEQVAAFDKKSANGDPYYNGTVVAGINASYYNMTTGKPSGVFVMNGNDVTGGDVSAYFAVMKDGSAKIGYANEYQADKGNIQEALGIFTMLVYDGEIVLPESTQQDTKKYPRQTIGITADGKVVILAADGNQDPYSIGLTMMEQAQVMIDLGCVYAGHLDGGGSMTYGSKAEGSDEFAIINRPADGSERAISNGLIIVSTEEQTTTFDHVVFSADNDYITVGSSINVKSVGVSSTGRNTDLPDDIIYQTTGGTYENGVFTATQNGLATITALRDGKVVGDVSINVVVPDTISFARETFVIPHGQTSTLQIDAEYLRNKVTINSENFDFDISNVDAGTLSGFDFTVSSNENVSDCVVTAVFKGTEISTTTKLSFGKASEIVWDFEDGSIDGFSGDWEEFYRLNGHYPNDSSYMRDPMEGTILTPFVSSVENGGKVRNGKYSMGITVDHSNNTTLGEGWLYWYLFYTGDKVVFKDDENGKKPTALGMWIYMPDEAVNARGGIYAERRNANGEVVNFGEWLDFTNNDDDGFCNAGNPIRARGGWMYVKVALAQYGGVYTATPDASTPSRHNEFIAFWEQGMAVPEKYTIYIDDITLEYSDVLTDSERPIISNTKVYDKTNDSYNDINGQTLNTDKISLSCNIAEDMTKDNYSGLDYNSAKIYIDGIDVSDSQKFKVTENMISLSDVTLTNGYHTVRFEVDDKEGNVGYETKNFTISSSSTIPTISLEGYSEQTGRLKNGSLYYLNVNSSAAEKVEKVTATIYLRGDSTFEADHMAVLNGFSADYKFNSNDNTLTVTIDKTGLCSSGKQTLVSIPVRSWTTKEIGSTSPIAGVTYNITSGQVEYTDDVLLPTGFVNGFSSPKVTVQTELYDLQSKIKADDPTWKIHVHSATAVADKDPTCTESGFTGRTYCEECKSIAEWGTTLPATGHNYELVNVVLKCTSCGDLFNGTLEGKVYVDGVIANGWINDSYYIDGNVLTGIQKVDDLYYNFGDDGISQGKYTGLLQLDGKWYYSKIGVLTGGWVQIGDDWHFFRGDTKNAAVGVLNYKGVTYTFNEQGMTKGAWSVTDEGTRYYYGPSYFVARDTDYMTLHEIDGKIYNFDDNGYLTYGIQVLRDSTSFKKYVFNFGSDGALIEKITDQGVVKASNGSLYYINEFGYVPINGGLVKYMDDYYYVVYSGKVAINSTKYVNDTNSNGLLPSGNYEFGSDGKMTTIVNGIVKIDGDYYYKENGEIQKNLGLIKFDGNYYYVCWSGKLKVDSDRGIDKEHANGLVKPGVYHFGTDGKMTNVINGIEYIDGSYYYKINGEIQKDLGLVEVDGNYYYVCYSGKLKADSSRGIDEEHANGLVKPGVYHFGTDGKMTDVVNGIDYIDGNYYYKVKGEIQKDLGLVEIGGDYYYVCYSGKLKVNSSRMVDESHANGLVKPGVYSFDSTGKMIIKK